MVKCKLCKETINTNKRIVLNDVHKTNEGEHIMRDVTMHTKCFFNMVNGKGRVVKGDDLFKGPIELHQRDGSPYTWTNNRPQDSTAP